MALSENEQKLAEKIVGKIVYDSESDLSDCDYIYDINDYGYIEVSGDDTYACRRSESYYKNLYKKEVLDDQLDEFEKNFKFFRYEYIDTAQLELYRRGKFSLVLDLSDNTVTLTQNKYFQYLSANKIKGLELTDENLSLIEKYESSKESVLEDLKKAESRPKEKLIESIRNNCAHNFAVKDYASYEYQIEESQENFNIYRTYYNKLKEGLNAEELEREEELYQEELKRQIEEQKAERQRNLDSEAEALKKEKDLVAKKNSENFKEFQNKILFQESAYGGDILYCPYVDENGIIEVKGKSEIYGWDFTKSYITKDDLHMLEDEFSQENFVGQILGYKDKSVWLGAVIQLYRNDNYSLVYHLYNGGEDGYFKVHPTKKFEESYDNKKPKLNVIETVRYGDILKKYSDFNAVISELNQKFADAFSKSNVESFIINHNAISVVENKGMSDFIIDSKYSLELEQKLVQNFTEKYLKENNYSKEEISRIYDEIERETQDRINRYEQDQVRGEENKKEYKIKNEREIEEAAREKLGLKVEKQEDEISIPNMLNIFGSISTNKPKVVSHREKINLEDSLIDLILKVSEGNPGAVNVVTKILMSKSENQDEPPKLMPIGPILALDDMNIRGSQIWCLFKNVYGIDVDNLNQGNNQKNFDDLVEKINKRDNEMVEKLNDYAKKHYMKDKAVVFGASFIHGDPLKDASSLYFDESEFVTEPALKENSSFMMARPKKTFAQKIKAFFSRKSKKEEKHEEVNLEDDEKDL